MEYRIRGEIRSTSDGRFTAIAVAAPLDGSDTGKTLQETFGTRAQALARLRAMTVQLGATIRSEGGEVLHLRTDD